jgi:hypothetical protein
MEPGSYPEAHTVADTWYAALTLLQSLTKTIPLFFSYTIVVVLWKELVHALFEVPPEVLNRVKVG